MIKNKTVLGYVLVISSAVIYGLMPLLTCFIYEEGVNSFSLVFIRNILSLPMLAIAAKIGGSSLKIAPRALPSIGGIALLGCCVTPMLLYTSYNYIDTGIATVFHFVYPALVMIISLVFLKNRFKFTNLVSLIICVAGICMFYTPGAELSVTGSILALLSGLAYAVYIVWVSAFKYKDISGFVFTFYGSLFCTAVSLIFCLCSGNMYFPTSPKGWLLCILFSLICNVGAVVLFQKGTMLIGGERASILSTVEPITSVVAGIAFLGEDGGIFTIIGTVLVVTASVLIAMSDMKNKKQE